MVWSCFPFIRSGRNHIGRHSERGKKTRQTEEEVGRQHQGMDRPGVRHVPEGSGEHRKMEESGCEIILGLVVVHCEAMLFSHNRLRDKAKHSARKLSYHDTLKDNDRCSERMLFSHNRLRDKARYFNMLLFLTQQTQRQR